MKLIGGVWTAVKSLFNQYTGIGKRPDGSPEAGDPIAAVFLPLAALIFGFAGVAATWIVSRIGFNLAAIVMGLAALAVFGGVRQIKAISSLFSAESRSVGAAVAATLILLFETLALFEVNQYRGAASLYQALLYLPVMGAAAMLSAASVLKSEECAKPMFAAVKGGHMLLGCLLVFLLMLPAFGFKSLVFVAASVLAGSVTALTLRRRGREETPYIAAITGQLVYLLFIMLVLPNPIFNY